MNAVIEYLLGYILAGFFLFVGGMGILTFIFNPPNGIGQIIIGAFPLLILFVILKKYHNGVETAFRKFSGHSSDYFYYRNYTGISINKKDRCISLKAGKSMKTYKFDSIRGWNWKVVSGGRIYGGGITGAIANAHNAGRNYRETGFFIDVSDIDHPRWKIFMSEGDMLKWAEIFEQNLNNR